MGETVQSGIKQEDRLQRFEDLSTTNTFNGEAARLWYILLPSQGCQPEVIATKLPQ
jgi:hypothetical protein